MPTLVLLRHGESGWNKENRFTGWVDVDLSEKGVEEARASGRFLRDAGVEVEVAHTSVQKRAIRTLQLALEEADRLWVPVRRSWRLNERHYGDLQGKDKTETQQQFGQEKYMLWRRSYDVRTPDIDGSRFEEQRRDPRYAELPPEVLPAAECLKDVVGRMLPYWQDGIVPDLRAGRTVVVAAHGNSLRALVKHLEGISDDDIVGLNIPTGFPLVYELDNDLRPLSAHYLPDDETALEAA